MGTKIGSEAVVADFLAALADLDVAGKKMKPLVEEISMKAEQLRMDLSLYISNWADVNALCELKRIKKSQWSAFSQIFVIQADGLEDLYFCSEIVEAVDKFGLCTNCKGVRDPTMDNQVNAIAWEAFRTTFENYTEVGGRLKEAQARERRTRQRFRKILNTSSFKISTANHLSRLTTVGSYIEDWETCSCRVYLTDLMKEADKVELLKEINRHRLTVVDQPPVDE